MLIEKSDSLNIYFTHSFNLSNLDKEIFPLINEFKPYNKKPEYIVNDICNVGIVQVAQSEEVFRSMFYGEMTDVKLEKVQGYDREALSQNYNCKSPYFVEAHWTYKLKNIAFKTWETKTIRLVWYYGETGMLILNR